MRSAPSHIDKYELRSVLARTATSVVYDGWDSDIARRVAIKTVPLTTLDDAETAEALARFKRGVQAAGKLAHPNVMSVYDYGETDDYAYIVMEFIDGPTLKQLLDDGTRFDVPTICKVMDEILGGLQYSHDHAVVHRDMKPANIMFTKGQRLKITDFGIARIENSNLTQAGMVIGTPAYMSPEQFMGEEVDWRTDIYSVGVILYQLITGARPYEGAYTTIMHKVLNAPVPRPSAVFPSISPTLDQVVLRAMAKSPAQRFQSATEFNAALHAVRANADPSVRPVVAPRLEAGAPYRQGRRKYSWLSPALTGAAVALLAVAGVGVGVYWQAKSQSDASAISHPQAAVDRQKMASLQPEQPPPSAAASAPSVMSPVSTPDQSLAPTARTDTGSVSAPSSGPILTDTTQDATSQSQTPDFGQRESSVPQPRQTAPPVPEGLPPVPGPPTQPQPSQAQKGDPVSRPAPARETRGGRAPRTVDTSKTTERKGEVRTTDKGDPGQDAMKKLKAPPSGRNDNPPADTFSMASAAPYPITSLNSDLGLLCRSLTPETAQEMGLNPPTGMLVMGVTAGSLAARAGIRANDVILKVNGSEMQNLSGLRATAGQSIPIEVFRNRKVIQLVLGAAS
jgi:serine/threonine-protein kinase